MLRSQAQIHMVTVLYSLYSLLKGNVLLEIQILVWVMLKQIYREASHFYFFYSLIDF